MSHAQTARHTGLVYSFTMKKIKMQMSTANPHLGKSTSRKKTHFQEEKYLSYNFSWNEQGLNLWRTYTRPHKFKNDKFD